MDRQFGYIVSNAEQDPLGFHLVHPSESESAESPILFNASEDVFHFHSTLSTQFSPLFRDEHGTDLFLVVV